MCKMDVLSCVFSVPTSFTCWLNDKKNDVSYNHVVVVAKLNHFGGSFVPFHFFLIFESSELM